MLGSRDSSGWCVWRTGGCHVHTASPDGYGLALNDDESARLRPSDSGRMTVAPRSPKFSTPVARRASSPVSPGLDQFGPTLGMVETRSRTPNGVPPDYSLGAGTDFRASSQEKPLSPTPLLPTCRDRLTSEGPLDSDLPWTESDSARVSLREGECCIRSLPCSTPLWAIVLARSMPQSATLLRLQPPSFESGEPLNRGAKASGLTSLRHGNELVKQSQARAGIRGYGAYSSTTPQK